MSEDLVFTVEFNVKPASKSEFISSLERVIENMSGEEAFVSAYLHQDLNDPDKLLIYERWSEPGFEDFVENQLKGKRYRDEYEANISDWLTEERKITVLKPLGSRS